MNSCIYCWCASVNPNGIKSLLANVLTTIFITGNQVFSNGPKIPSKDPPDCAILSNWVYNNFKQAEELFSKVLRSERYFHSKNYQKHLIKFHPN